MRAQEWEGRVRARWSPASSALSACCVLPQEGGADAGPGSAAGRVLVLWPGRGRAVLPVSLL